MQDYPQYTHPFYWSALLPMGDAAPLPLEYHSASFWASSSNYWLWIVGLLVMVGLVRLILHVWQKTNFT